MRFLGLELPPSSIDLPLSISFPLRRQPRLDVTVWGMGVPNPAKNPVLAIKAVNVTETPVEITGVYAGFIYTSLPVELIFGHRAVKLPLRELSGKRQPPLVLQGGESVLWTANLHQLTGELEEKRLSLASRSRFLDFSDIDVERWRRRGRLAIAMRNAIAMQSQGKPALVIRDGRDGLHKAKVRWQPPVIWRGALARRWLQGVVTEVEIFEDLLLLHPRGARGVSLPIKLAHVVGAEVDPKLARAGSKNSEIAEEDTVFFNVNDPEKAVVILLKNERYARLVIEVDDPPSTVAAIREALSGVERSP